MTNDKTVTMSRELIEEVVAQLDDFITGSVLDRLKSALAAPGVDRQPDAIIEGVMTSVGITHAIYASTVSLKDKEQVKLYTSPPAPVAVDIDERAEFEAEMLSQNPEADLERNSNDNYMNFYLECAWNGWQQRAFLDKVKELNQ